MLWDLIAQINCILKRLIRNLELLQSFKFFVRELANHLTFATFVGIMDSLNQTVFDVVDVPESPSIHDIQNWSDFEVLTQKFQLLLLKLPLNRSYFLGLQTSQLVQYLAQPIVFAFQSLVPPL